MSLMTDGMFTGASPAARVSQRATAREGARRTLISLLLLLLAAAGARGARPLPQHLRSDPARDMAVLAKPSGGYTVFVADSRARNIRYRDVTAAKDVESWDLSEFEPFLIKGGRVPQHPTALAVNATTLFVVDNEEEGVFAVDLGTRVSQPLLQRPLIHKPLSVAVSEAGLIAVGQDDESVMLYNPATPDVPPRPMPGEKIDDPVRLQFIPSDPGKVPSLLVLDSEDEGSLTLYEPSGRDSYTPRQLQIPGSVAARLEVREDTTLDSAFADGNFYLTEGRNWAVFSRVGLTSARWVLFPAMYRVTPDRIREAGGALFVLDAKQGTVLRLLLKQMTVRMEVTAPEANVMLGELYQGLYDERNGSLPEREYVVHSSDTKKTLEEILKAQHVLAPGAYSPVFAPVENVTPPPADRFEHLLCLLNKRLNDWKCPDTLNSPVAEADRRLPRRFGERQALVIPGLGVERLPYEGSVWLPAGKSVEETLRTRLMVEQAFAALTTEYLMRKNPAYYRTIDYEMTRRGYTLSSPLSPPELTLGSLVRITQNREQAAPAQDCSPTWAEVAGQKQTEPVPELTEKLRSYAPSLEYVPHKETTTSDTSVLAEWSKLGVVALEMVFDGPVEERGSRRVLAGQTGAPQCWGALAGKDTYVVGDVIRVAGARFRLLKKDGETLQPKPVDLARWGIAGETDESADWSFRVPKSYVLAYRPLPWDGRPLASEKRLSKRNENKQEPELRFVTDPHTIKPGSGQDIWAKTSGKFVLPGFRWDIKLLTDSTNLAEGSVIRKWAAKYPDKVYVWPATGRPSGDTSPDTIAGGDSAATPQDDLARVTGNREQLRKSIAFPTDVNSGDIIIGLMERAGSITTLNQDFAWKEIKEGCDPPDVCPWDFVWLEPPTPEDVTSQPDRLRRAVRMEPRTVRTREQIGPQAEEYWKYNHGTHVAGLLASNYDGAPGLVPDAELCWLQLGNPPVPLPDQITQQNSNELRVINVSQEFLDNSYDWLRDKLDREGDPLKLKLMVIAAGNDGCDLNKPCTDTASGREIRVKPPVAWLHEFNNLLSVSATDMDHKLLFKEDGSYRVNYGVKYVDLLAPGYEIYSSTERSAYAATTGTSQAAPLVTATAAVLAKVTGATEPSLLKGRLIYTADWEGSTLEERNNWDPNHSYLERVWGGSLNAGRAIFEYNRDIFLYAYGAATKYRAIHGIPDRAVLVIKNLNEGKPYFMRQPKGDSEPIKAALSDSDSKIEFGRVLRITRLKNGFFRIIYKSKTSPWEMRIIMDASIGWEKPIKYTSYEEIIGDKIGPMQYSSGEPLRLESVIDYVGRFSKMETRIAFY